jgi:hypothetical protein
MSTCAYDLPDGTQLFVTNVYNRPSEQLPLNCLTSVLQYNGLQIYGGDLNLHDESWGMDPLSEQFKRKQTPKARRFSDIISEHLELKTRRGEPTWQRGDQASVIDLMFASPDLEGTVCNLRHDFATPTSDHVAIETTLRCIHSIAIQRPGNGTKPTKTPWRDVCTITSNRVRSPLLEP